MSSPAPPSSAEDSNRTWAGTSRAGSGEVANTAPIRPAASAAATTGTPTTSPTRATTPARPLVPRIRPLWSGGSGGEVEIRCDSRRSPRVSEMWTGCVGPWKHVRKLQDMISTAQRRPVVLICEELSPATVDALGPDAEIRYCDGADRAQLLAALPDADALLVRSATQVDAEA